jgi:hypothetical protein
MVKVFDMGKNTASYTSAPDIKTMLANMMVSLDQQRVYDEQFNREMSPCPICGHRAFTKDGAIYVCPCLGAMLKAAPDISLISLDGAKLYGIPVHIGP